MRLALATHTPEVIVPPRVALLSGTFEERLRKAKTMAFDGVELMVARPTALNREAILACLQALNLAVAAVASGPVSIVDGLTLLAAKKDLMEHAAERLLQLIDLAAALQAPLVTIGSFRGRAEWAGGPARHFLVETIRMAADDARQKGIRLALEPLNRYETDIVQTAEQGLEILGEIDSPQVGLLLDTFHMNIEEPNLPAAIERVAEAGRLWHIHIGDSNRLPPGQGHINFESIVRALENCGYTGWLSAELNPFPDPDSAARSTIERMLPILQRCLGPKTKSQAEGE